jgi:hypothetical protein
MDPPADGDELARVVPLRRRNRELTAAPGARGSLPRERAPFDPEIEPGDIPSKPRLPRTAALQLRRPTLRSRGVRNEPQTAASRRYSTAVLLTGAAGAAVATAAALVLLVSIVNQSPPAPAAHGESLRRTAGALAPNKTGVLSASTNPLAVTGQPAARKTGRTTSTRAHHARPKPIRPRPTHDQAGNRTLSINHQSAVVASYTPATSATSSRSRPDTQSPAVTNSTPAPAPASTPHHSSTPSSSSSSASSSINRPAFGEQGLLGPGSSPDS